VPRRPRAGAGAKAGPPLPADACRPLAAARPSNGASAGRCSARRALGGARRGVNGTTRFFLRATSQALCVFARCARHASIMR
jgi:hypothetical protein